jgi:hypothetical protein
VEFTEIVAIALTLGGGSLLQSAVGFGFGLFVVPLLLLITDLAIFNSDKTASAVDDRNSFSDCGYIHFVTIAMMHQIAILLSHSGNGRKPLAFRPRL